jgi:hypothetical protein
VIRLQCGELGSYTEITVKGITPQLPIREGLTIHPDTDLSSVHRASWYICKVSFESIEQFLECLLAGTARWAALDPNCHILGLVSGRQE